MYKYKVFMPESRFWVEKEEEIRALAEDVNKAIEIVVRRWRSLWPFAIFPIDVSGGCHERDTGYLLQAHTAADYCAQKLGWHTVECTENDVLRSIESIGSDVLKAAEAVIG